MVISETNKILWGTNFVILETNMFTFETSAVI